MKKLFALLILSVATVCQAAPYPSPADWRNESIYQILTDRFYDGNPANNNAEAAHGSSFAPANNSGIHGGDFKGIQDKLGYIKSLGATAIWISPIPLNAGGNSAYHGYHAQDYYTLAPHWGTMADLTNMVGAAHALGIKVILDIVVNHTAALLTSTDANWPNYVAPPGGYHLSYANNANQEAFPFNPTNVNPPLITTLFHTNGNIQSFNYPQSTQQVVLGQLDNLDDLATETTYVRTNMMKIYTNWVGRADFDGFRVDTAIEVDYGFWQYWCPQLHQFGSSIGKSNFFMFGEAFNGSDQYVGSYTGTEGGGPFKFDSMLDYPLYELVNSIFATASGKTQQIQNHYNAFPTDYDSNSWYRMVTFLDNHDNARFLSSGNANGNTNNLTVALQFLYTSRGIPCLYYGTEQAFVGDNNNNDNREDMFAGQWEPDAASVGDNFNETHPLFQQVARLNNFRRLYPALRTGVHNNLSSTSGPGLFAYSRVLSNEEVFVVFNTAGSNQTLTNCGTTYSPGTVLVNLLNTNDTIVVTSGSGTNTTPPITVPGMTTKIYIAQSLVLPLDPVVVSQSPSHAAVGVPVTASVVLQFNKPMNTNSVQGAFSMTPSTTGTFTWDALRETMTFKPSGGWLPSTTNLVHLATNAMDSVSGNAFYASFDTYFVTPLPAPQNLKATGVSTNQINLVWNSASAAIGYIVKRGGSQIATTTATNYSDSGLMTDTMYCYTVAATNAGGVSADSSQACALTTVASTASTNLLAYWTFDEGSGTIAYDSSGNANTGTVVNGTWTSGMINGALSFDGATSEVTVPYSGSLNPVSTITIAAWINAASWANTPRILEKGLDDQYALFVNVSGQLEFLLGGVTNGRLVTIPPSAGVWHHVAATYDGLWMRLYIDGQIAASQSASGAPAITPEMLVIGGDPSGSPLNLFDGVIDDVQIYGSALPAAQIGQFYSTDTVGDGIPNWWRQQYFGNSSSTNAASCITCDFDGTGQNNQFKFIAGLDPTNPASAFRIISLAPQGKNLLATWTTVGGHSNALQSASGTVGGSYSNLFTDISPVIIVPGTGPTTTNFLLVEVLPAFGALPPAQGPTNLANSGTSTVEMSALDTRGLSDSAGAVPMGSLLMMGTFGMDEPTIRSNFSAGKINAIMAAFTPYGAPFAVGDLTTCDAVWDAQTSGVGFGGLPLYLVAFDQPTVAAATQMGIFTAPSWVFPTNTSTSFDIVTATDFVVGSNGGSLSIYCGAPVTFTDTAQLAIIPSTNRYYRVRQVP